MMDERAVREMKQQKLNYVETENKRIAATLAEVDEMRGNVKAVEQEIMIINRILGDV